MSYCHSGQTFKIVLRIDDDSLTPDGRPYFVKWNMLRDSLLPRTSGSHCYAYQFFDSNVRKHLTCPLNRTLVKLDRMEGVASTGDSNQHNKQIRIYPGQWYGIILEASSGTDPTSETWDPAHLADMATAWEKACCEYLGTECVHSEIRIR